MLSRENPPAEVVVRQIGEGKSMIDRLDEMRTKVDNLRNTPDPMALALEAPLGEQERALIAGWYQDERNRREDHIAELDKFILFFEEAAEQESEAD